MAQEAVRLRSSYADAFTGMGVSLKELKRKEEAEHCFAQVVRLRPHCALSLGNLAGQLSCVQDNMPSNSSLHVVGKKQSSYVQSTNKCESSWDWFIHCFCCCV